MSQASPIAAAQVEDAAPLFAALGDETRLRLLVRLAASGPESITHLSAESAVSRQAIKKHLDVLSKARERPAVQFDDVAQPLFPLSLCGVVCAAVTGALSSSCTISSNTSGRA